MVAYIARLKADKFDHLDSDMAYIMGLMQDIGIKEREGMN